MTITTLILLWVLRIASSAWVGILIYCIFIFDEDVRITYPVRDNETNEILHYKTRPLTFFERQKSMWCTHPKDVLIRISIYAGSIALCVLLWLNLQKKNFKKKACTRKPFLL